jgi:hypothetical protein
LYYVRNVGPERHEDEREHEARRRRKERILHTRISEDLAEDIRRVAEDLRVPVSNIVRNVLEEAFSVVETVTDNVGVLLEDVVDEAEAARQRLRARQRRRRREAERARQARRGAEPETEAARRQAAGLADVVGWQALRVERPQVCAECGGPIERGDEAFVGVTPAGLGPAWLCVPCMEARR